MKHVRMMGVAFFLLAMQLVCLPVKADDKADLPQVGSESASRSVGQYSC